ncbi:C-X-C motif chemokine 9 [Perognathus longimembris pacificus]|uniref:C-X-C motif chemokine 9 n=1 Tax=Perognathus longimembris pacificus TaxID=214514 RepID=UPI002019A7EB|nr:C-X-C motif chemokine 9 [Perognathus longimembris pacificus]
MEKRGAPFLVGSILLLLIAAQGNPIIRTPRCTCIGSRQERINPKSLKDLKQFAPSPSCEETEIIATLRNGEQTCLDPKSASVKKLLKNWEKQISQKKRQKKGEKHQKFKKVQKIKKSQRPHQRKAT